MVLLWFLFFIILPVYLIFIEYKLQFILWFQHKKSFCATLLVHISHALLLTQQSACKPHEILHMWGCVLFSRNNILQLGGVCGSICCTKFHSGLLFSRTLSHGRQLLRCQVLRPCVVWLRCKQRWQTLLSGSCKLSTDHCHVTLCDDISFCCHMCTYALTAWTDIVRYLEWFMSSGWPVFSVFWRQICRNYNWSW